MLTGARQTLSHTDSIAIYLDNELLKLVDNQKLLGITIDNTLSWATQVDCYSIKGKSAPLARTLAFGY